MILASRTILAAETTLDAVNVNLAPGVAHSSLVDIHKPLVETVVSENQLWN